MSPTNIMRNKMSAHKTKPLTEEEAKQRWNFFGPPPVLKTEDNEAYANIRQGHLAFYRPTSILDLSLIRELVDTEWEMFRLIRIRTKLLNTRYVRPGEKEGHNLLERPFWSAPEVDKGVELLDRLDKWFNKATLRRNSLLQMIECYCPGCNDNIGIAEAESEKVDEKESKQIAAPPLAPTEGTADDVATQNSSEPIERAKE
jgi:hypothetical protein